MFWAESSGIEPIFEKRSVMIFRRSMSLFISAMMMSFSPILVLSISFQAMSDEIGVPSWWAVSFDKPAQSLSCAARLSVDIAHMTSIRNRAMMDS